MLLTRIKDFCIKLFFIFIIEILRLFSRHDTYIVAGQPNLLSLDPLDSWTFFEWLQNHGVPSRYLIHEKSDFYQNELKNKGIKDIIVLRKEISSAEILYHIDLWRHARAFAVEWNMLNNTLDNWLKRLRDMRYVFLQHGITGVHTSNILINGLQPFNDINVTSLKEKKIIESLPGIKPDTCFLAGMTRYDRLKDESDHCTEEKILFVMFTWRNFPKNMTPEEIDQSCYCQGIHDLFCNENIERLKRLKIKIVMAMHHSLLSSISEIHTHPNIVIAEQKDIKYWISHAHGFLTDFSSIAYDFMFLGKPVVFWIPDLFDKTLDPNDVGYGNKVLSAIERRKEFFNTVDTSEEAISLIEQYAKNNFILEDEKRKVSEQWFDNRSDFSRKVYEAIEQRLKTKQK